MSLFGTSYKDTQAIILKALIPLQEVPNAFSSTTAMDHRWFMHAVYDVKVKVLALKCASRMFSFELKVLALYGLFDVDRSGSLEYYEFIDKVSMNSH